jgi:hypothetical protein
MPQVIVIFGKALFYFKKAFLIYKYFKSDYLITFYKYYNSPVMKNMLSYFRNYINQFWKH